MAFGDRTLTRSPSRGPKDGTYAVISFDRDVVAASTTYILRRKLPFACRVMEVDTVYDVLTGAAPDYQLRNTTDSLDVIATRALPAADTHETITPTSSTALTNRDFDKGDVLTLTVTAGVGEAVDGLTVTVTVWVRDHVVAAEAND